VPIGSTNTFTATATNTPPIVIPTYSLSVVLAVPTNVTVGQQVSVLVTVYNNGNVTITGVSPATPVITGSSLQLVSTPLPSVSLPAGASTTFTFVYNVVAEGNVTIKTTASGNSNTVVSPDSNIALTSAKPIVPTPAQTIAFFVPVDTRTPVVLIYPNPNPTPGTTPDRVIAFTVTKPVSKTEFKIYTSMGRLIRKYENPTTYSQGGKAIVVPGVYFQGMARGVYYYVIIITDVSGKEAKSPIAKVVIQ